MEPSQRFKTVRRGYRVNLRLAKDPTIGADLVQFAERSFAEKVTRLVSLLARNNRFAEARQIARRASRVWPDAELQKHLAAAAAGEVYTQ